MSDKHPDICEHGQEHGPLVLCDAPPEATGANPVWKNRDGGCIIVTPGWCRTKCRKREQQTG